MNRWNGRDEPPGCMWWQVLEILALAVILYYLLHYLGLW